MRLADGREQQIQIAGNVGHRSDGRAGIAGQRLLLDGNDRRKAEDEIDIGFRDLCDEPLRKARERLHVAALAFRVDGVEGEARFAGAGKTGDHDQAVAGNLDGDVLEVMNPRSLHRDRRARRSGPAFRPVFRHRLSARQPRRPPAVSR
jgi:hypothetical protein